MALHLPSPALPGAHRVRSRAEWRQRTASLAWMIFRLRAWGLSRLHRDAHPVADLIARGNWAALDDLVDSQATQRDSPSHPGYRDQHDG